jgi:hypothetical protein
VTGTTVLHPEAKNASMIKIVSVNNLSKFILVPLPHHYVL